MSFSLRHVDVVAQSAVCDTAVSMAEGHSNSRSFVVTYVEGRILGFESFHAEIHKRRFLNEDCTLFIGELRVCDAAQAATPPRPCAWVYRRSDSGEYCCRVYRDETTALKAVGPAGAIRPRPPTAGLDQTNGSVP